MRDEKFGEGGGVLHFSGVDLRDLQTGIITILRRLCYTFSNCCCCEVSLDVHHLAVEL